jgi:peptidoglycan pentaglycine glycine transferase (the first glycine)
MEFIELSASDQKKYNDFVENHSWGSIHQTWEWGIFQSKSANRDFFRAFVLIDKKGKITSSALLIRQKLPFGKCWLYCPRGPLIDLENPQQSQELFIKIKEFAKKQNAIFFRFDPPITSDSENFQKLSSGARPAHAHYQPEHTVILDLSLSEEDLLKQMKPKGRYNIKVAQKHGVKIRQSHGDPEDIKLFYELLKETTSRDRFSGHPLSYYEDMLHTLGPQRARLYLAEFENQIIAGTIVTFFKDTAIYYFGASGNAHRNTMAPYLLQWHAITEAKKLGFHWYDFLGIAPPNEPNHPWAGVSDFKLKFGGQHVEYFPAQEIIYKPFWHAAIRLAKWVKRGLR